jgi:hypothetical protein
MRGFALTDALIGLAVVSLVMTVLITRAPDLEGREAERRLHLGLIDATQAAMAMSQSIERAGHWVLYDGEVTGASPGSEFNLLTDVLTRYPDANYRLELNITAKDSTWHRRVQLIDRRTDVTVYEAER